MRKVRRVCIVNRYFPPAQSPSGFFAEYLAVALSSCDKIDVITCSLRPRSLANKSIPNDPVRRVYIPGGYSGKGKVLRLFSSFFESLFLIVRARMLGANYYIILTDPPFLNFWSPLVLFNKYWFLWVMDLYPHAFVSAQLVTIENIFYKLYRKVSKLNTPDLLITLGPNQGRFLKTSIFSDSAQVSVPVGIKADISGPGPRPEWYDDQSGILFGYIGNVGEAHDEQFIIEFAQALKNTDHKLVYCGHGRKSENIKRTIRPFKWVTIAERFVDGDFCYLDVALVSLKDSWTHICVPSKALSAVEYGCSILFCGSEFSDTWEYVKEVGWRISSPAESQDFIASLVKNEVYSKKQKTLALAGKLRRQRSLAFSMIKKQILNGR